jgi:hypothetical protein
MDANANGIIDCIEPPVKPDADPDGIPDASDNCPTTPNADQADCDYNGIGDACTIAACPAESVDCGDCNQNGIPDACDISSGTSYDNNEDGTPDECQYTSPTGTK